MSLFRELCKLHDSHIVVEVKSSTGLENIKVPAFSIFRLGPLNCSAYVRMAAQEIFGKNYSFSHAWNRRYEDVLVEEIINGELSAPIREGVLQKGMLVGIYNPASRYNGRTDQEGKIVMYTHVSLFLGVDRHENSLFAEQFIAQTRIITERQMRREGLVPKEIIDSRN